MSEIQDIKTPLHAPAQADEHARRAALTASVLNKLGNRSLVLVGMMGAGKTSIGRRLAACLNLPFIDADVAIEGAAGMTISEIFARHGESYFRDGERRVIARILGEGQTIVATGGGAWMNAATRDRVAACGVSIWLKAEIEVLLQRVRKRANRPLLQTQDPEQALRRLTGERYPVYALADLCVASRDGPHHAMVDLILEALDQHLDDPGHNDRRSAQPAAPAQPDTTQSPDITTTPADISVAVDLAARRYDINIGKGAIRNIGETITRLAPGAACAIVTDANVARHWLPAIETALSASGIRHTHFVVAPGEGSKSWQTLARVCDHIIAAHMERGDLVLALGGGVVGDLAGFAAATIRRGMRYVQIPTTLLAQVDSSVGGKTAINSEHGKNLVGAFHQPSLVVIDTETLATLPEREFRAGYAEMAKYGLINDHLFFAWLENHWREVFALGPALTKAIATSCRSKAEVVARDETELGDRALLNLGHTFGHALETITHFNSGRLVHGEGVAIGMACAFRFSVRLGHCAADDAARVETHLRAVGLPTRFRDINGWNAGPDAILDAMRQDKKVQRGALTFILARGIGQSFIAKDVPASQVIAFLREELGY